MEGTRGSPWDTLRALSPSETSPYGQPVLGPVLLLPCPALGSQDTRQRRSFWRTARVSLLGPSASVCASSWRASSWWAACWPPIHRRAADPGKGVPAAAADKQLDEDASGQRLLRACPGLVPPCGPLLPCVLVASCSPGDTLPVWGRGPGVPCSHWPGLPLLMGT